MLSINTNLSSLIAQNSMSSATKLLNQAVERMTTGYKINHAKDNAANYSIATNLTTKINSYMVAEENCAMGLDLLATANGSLDQISDKLTRLRDLQTQASNGTYGQQSLNAINAEANALVDEINRLYQTAEYNGRKLFANQDTATTPAVATYGARAASANTTYTDEEVAEMTTITEAKAAGSFSSGETYSINSVQEICDFRDMVNAGQSGAGATFVLAKDIDLSGINWTPIGDASYSFQGSFDGNGNVISHLTIDTTNVYLGLFGNVKAYLRDITIQNVGLEGVNIKGDGMVGALIAFLTADRSSITVNNNYVTGNVMNPNEDYATGNSIGGLIGHANNDEGTIILSNNYSTCSVSIDNVYPAGGILGGINNYGTLTVNNNYATGNINGGVLVGGVVGFLGGYTITTTTISNNYATGVITSTIDAAGGLIGGVENSGTITLNNNYSTSSVNGITNVGGLIGYQNGNVPNFISNASVQADNNATQMSAEQIAQTYTPEMMGFTEANGWTIVNGQPVLAFSMAARNANSSLSGSNNISLQIGINSGESSQIEFDVSFALGNIDDLRMIGVDTTTDYLSKLDNMLATVNAKQTEFGAVENRLNSALDEISIQYENLVSSRSTIRDADIAEVSSEYIRQQILQQASATLMATANQSPAIALQLI